MKYCPFCGAELPARRPFFLPGVWGSPACGPRRNVQEPAAPTEEKRRKRSQKSQAAPEVDPNCDGYYDDVQPIDAENRQREGSGHPPHPASGAGCSPGWPWSLAGVWPRSFLR